MFRTSRIAALAAASAIAALAAGAAAAQEHVFKFHHFLSAKSPAHLKMLEPWAKAVEENSGGKVVKRCAASIYSY